MTYLCEALEAAPNVDREKGIIHGVKVLGHRAPTKGLREAAKGRRYEDAAMEAAVPLYEGVPVHLNHDGSEGKKRAGRVVEDTFGEMRSVRFDKAKRAVYGDLHYNKAHPRAAQMAEAAERFPKTLGMSHMADGAFAIVGGEQVISKILTVECVDLVKNPATTTGLYESEGDETPANPGAKKMNLAEARTENPSLVASLTEEIKAELAEGSELATVKAELAEAKSALAAANEKGAKAERDALVATKLTESKLPASAISDLFKKSLVEAKDVAAIDALIEDRKKIAGAVKTTSPKSGHQRVTESKNEGGVKSLAECDTKEAAAMFRA